MNIIADTDVLIDYLSGQEPSAARIALEIEHGTLRTTAITRFELMAGAKGERKRKLVHELLEAIPTLPLDADAADRAAEVRGALERKGVPIGMGDSLIAGIVLANRGVLITRNVRPLRACAGAPDLRTVRRDGLRLTGPSRGATGGRRCTPRGAYAAGWRALRRGSAPASRASEPSRSGPRARPGGSAGPRSRR